MNNLFFLLIIPFLIIPTAYAEVGKNFDTIENPNGSITWISHFERILDSNQNYQDYIFTDNPSFLQVETAGASIQLDKTSCKFSFFNSGIIGNKTPILIDDIIPFQSVDGSDIWNKINTLDNTNCEIVWAGTTLKAIKNVAGLGNLEYSYKFLGTSWETELKVTNLSGLNDRLFGFEQEFNLNRDTIKYGGIQRNLDNFNGQILDRTYLINNEAKVINLLNGYNFDFDLGFNNLNQILINDTGVNSSLLTFQYFLNQNILSDGSTLRIDPSIVIADQDGVNAQTSPATGASCPAAVSQAFGTSLIVRKPQVSDNDRCYVTASETDITGIPDGAMVMSIIAQIDVAASVIIPTEGCDIVQISTYDVSTTSHPTMWNEITTGAAYLTADPVCNTATTNAKTANFGATAWADLETHLTTDNLFTYGIRINDYDNRAAGGSLVGASITNLELIVHYFLTTAITDLVVDDVRSTAVDLSWSPPTVFNGTIQGYMINFTTPHSQNVASQATPDTETTTTSYTVFDLMGLANYSFRVGAITTLGNGNMSGNVVNITTGFDPTASFSPGTFNITATGTDVRNFKFERIDLNSTALLLNVTYPNSFNTTCNFHYKFAMINNTFYNVADIAINSAEDEASFRFEGVDNEIIDVLCTDENTNSTGNYLITQTSFMILEQIQDFQNGVFGTAGKFGALDFITVIAVTVSMIGFNRVNESVGVVLSVIMIGAFSVFQIIQWETTFTASLALVVLWAYTNTRKT